MKPLKLNIQFFASDTRIGVEFDVNMAAAKKALQILNNEVKKSEYAWKAYAAETEDWEDTSEGLQKKVDALTDKQKKQKEIVENLSKQYKASEERYGENHKLTSRLAKDYEAAKYELAKTNTELKDYTKKLDDANDETDDLSKATDDLEGKFTVLKSTMSQLIADGLKKLASVAIDTAREMVNVGISFESSFAGETILRPSC